MMVLRFGLAGSFALATIIIGIAAVAASGPADGARRRRLRVWAGVLPRVLQAILCAQRADGSAGAGGCMGKGSSAKKKKQPN